MKFKDIIRGIFFPQRCEICGSIKPLNMPFCEKCGIDSNSISASACPDCGHEKCVCQSNANMHLPHFTAVYYYQGQIKKSMLSFKFSGESIYGDIFGMALFAFALGFGRTLYSVKGKSIYPNFDTIVHQLVYACSRPCKCNEFTLLQRFKRPY